MKITGQNRPRAHTLSSLYTSLLQGMTLQSLCSPHMRTGMEA